MRTIVIMRKVILCLTLLLMISSSFGYVTKASFEETDTINSDLELVYNAVKKKPSEDNCKCIKNPKPMDCGEILENGHNVSGVYTIWPRNRAAKCETLEVYCDMETDGGGWIVIQRRGDYGNGVDYFVKNWQTYKDGFGNINKEFWIGNDNIHALTNQGSYSARFDMRNVKGRSGFALYDTFWIEGEEEKYRLHIDEYSGTAGGAISNHHLKLFYTKDQPNIEPGRTITKQHVGGWWNNAMPSSNLNGLNLQGEDTEKTYQGIVWMNFAGFLDSLAFTEIKLRSKKFN